MSAAVRHLRNTLNFGPGGDDGVELLVNETIPLAIHQLDVTIHEPDSGATGVDQRLYELDCRSAPTINTTTSDGKCLPPSDNNANFDYCFVAEFNTIIRAGRLLNDVSRISTRCNVDICGDFCCVVVFDHDAQFAGLMSREQRRSVDDELSQSAYDSAMAGVEDAKRVIIAARAGSAAAQNALAATPSQCDTVAQAGIATLTNGEVLIESSSTGEGSQLNQAYTCVKIDMQPDSYVLDLDQVMRSEMVPLRAVASYDRIKIEWQSVTESPDGLLGSCGAGALTDVDEDVLCPQASWGSSDQYAALLRAQVINPGASFDVADLDTDGFGNTAFLYPTVASEFVNLDTAPRYVDGSIAAGTTNLPKSASVRPRHPCWMRPTAVAQRSGRRGVCSRFSQCAVALDCHIAARACGYRCTMATVTISTIALISMASSRWLIRLVEQMTCIVASKRD